MVSRKSHENCHVKYGPGGYTGNYVPIYEADAIEIYKLACGPT